MRSFVLAVVCLGLVASSLAQTCTLNPLVTPAAPVFENGFTNSNLFNLNFLSTLQFSSIRLDFLGFTTPQLSNTYCDVVLTSGSLTVNNVLWALNQYNSGQGDHCSVRLTAGFVPQTALSQCFTQTASGTTDVYQTTVKVTTVQARESIRGTSQTTVTTTAISLRLRFQREVNVTLNTSSITVRGSPSIQSNVQSQVFNPSTLSTEIVLYTSINPPYQLSPKFVDPDWTHVGPDAAFSTPGFTLSAVSHDGTGVACNAFAVCSQKWRLTITPPANTCQIDGTVSFFFAQVCNLFDDTCLNNVPSPNTTISFTLASVNFCTQVVKDVSFTAALSSYQDASFETTATNFIYNQRAYFRVAVTAGPGPAVASTTILTVHLDSFNNRLALDLTGQTMPTVGNFIYYASSSSASFTAAQAGFSIVMGPSTVVLADNDFAQLVTLSIVIRVAYAGLNGEVTHKLQTLKYSLQADTNTVDLNPVIDFQVTAASSSSSTQGASVSSGLLAIVIGVACAILAVAALTAFFLYRAGVAKKHVEKSNAAQKITVVNPETPTSDA